ncbi:MAG: hypothetical protein WC929_03740 [Bacilli bacterium]|jgi:hypothetical protein|nr:hypothetical protein [Bacilli bacterium]HNY74360.1 hypothetical protein [Bacilli bacterium]HOH67812.1 hypothetical protein [Bacilli bacterium]
MENKSVTEQIKEYCLNHQNTIFDVDVLYEYVFQTGNFNSFRQQVSRAAKAMGMINVGKGVLYIGKDPSPEELKRAVEEFYIKECYGFIAGLPLLYKYRIILEEPETTAVKCVVSRCKDIRGNIVIPTKTMVNQKTVYFREALEICSLEKYYKDYEKAAYALKDLLSGQGRYLDSYFANPLFTEYGVKTIGRFIGLLSGLEINSNLRQKLHDFSGI